VEICIEQWNSLACGLVYTVQTHSGLVYAAGCGVTQRYHISAEVADGSLAPCGHSLGPRSESRWVPTENNAGSPWGARSAGSPRAWKVKPHSCFEEVVHSLKHP